MITIIKKPWLYELGHSSRRPLTETPHGHSETSPDALKRSWDLFSRFLTPEQEEAVLSVGYFDTEVRYGRHRVYLIAIESYVNVCAGNTTWCTNPIGRVPLWDKLLAQLLSIQSSEFFDYARRWHDINDPLYYLRERW